MPAERDASGERGQTIDPLYAWFQMTLAKGQGGRVIALIEALDDWMQVCHQQESEIERLEADVARLRGSLDRLGMLADSLFPPTTDLSGGTGPS